MPEREPLRSCPPDPACGRVVSNTEWPPANCVCAAACAFYKILELDDAPSFAIGMPNWERIIPSVDDVIKDDTSGHSRVVAALHVLRLRFQKHGILDCTKNHVQTKM